MTVYAVMRGTELLSIYKKQSDAEWYANHLNRKFVHGKRYTVVTMIVKEDNTMN